MDAEFSLAGVPGLSRTPLPWEVLEGLGVSSTKEPSLKRVARWLGAAPLDEIDPQLALAPYTWHSVDSIVVHIDSSKATSPAKSARNVQRFFYKTAVQDGFQGTFEEFSRQMQFHVYERAVKLGRFQGTYDAWRCETAPGRTPGVNGQDVGRVYFSMHYKYTPPPGTLLRMYYDPEKHLLRFQTQDGEPLPEYTDIDLIPRAALSGCRPLLILAHSEGLIPTVPDGYLPSFDLNTNIKSGYYVRANRFCNDPHQSYEPSILLPGAREVIRLKFSLSKPENFDYLRFFPYIHEDQTLRLWDVERGVDAPLKTRNGVQPWEPQLVKKQFPGLFEHAKRLGYWKEF
ncbi:hypothetical protein FRC00_006891 [Tulasnella sp. 408]|nr:hypothetical protein FRC00_006891 [Tulasnella sp. 408]